MKKMWVDDIRPAPDASWHVARTANAAIRALAGWDTWEEISLDHDISHQVAVGELSRPYPCEETFASVAYFIAEKWWTGFNDEKNPLAVMRPFLQPKITIHSSNPVGAREMQLILQSRGIKSELRPGSPANRLETIL